MHGSASKTNANSFISLTAYKIRLLKKAVNIKKKNSVGGARLVKVYPVV